MNNGKKDVTSRISQRKPLSDDERFKEAYLTWHAPLSRFIYMKIGSVEKTEDLVQDVFLRVWRAWDSIDPDRPIKSYLFKVAHRLMIDYFRKRGSEKKYRDSLELPGLAHQGQDTELKTMIQLAIEKMNEPMKSVFLLGRYEGLKYAEIAEICELSYKQVFRLMEKAMLHLKKELEISG